MNGAGLSHMVRRRTNRVGRAERRLHTYSSLRSPPWACCGMTRGSNNLIEGFVTGEERGNQFSSGPNPRSVGRRGPAGGGGGGWFLRASGALLNAPFHSEQYTSTQVRGATFPLAIHHKSNWGGDRGGGEFYAPIHRGQKTVAGAQVGSSSLLTVGVG